MHTHHQRRPFTHTPYPIESYPISGWSCENYLNPACVPFFVWQNFKNSFTRVAALLPLSCDTTYTRAGRRVHWASDNNKIVWRHVFVYAGKNWWEKLLAELNDERSIVYFTLAHRLYGIHVDAFVERTCDRLIIFKRSSNQFIQSHRRSDGKIIQWNVRFIKWKIKFWSQNNEGSGFTIASCSRETRLMLQWRGMLAKLNCITTRNSLIFTSR